MLKLDGNRIAVLVAVITLVVITAISGYRLEIGTRGLMFERPALVAGQIL